MRLWSYASTSMLIPDFGSTVIRSPQMVICLTQRRTSDSSSYRKVGGLPRIRVVIAIVTGGVFAIHVDFPLLFFDLCHGVEDKASRET